MGGGHKAGKGSIDGLVRKVMCPAWGRCDSPDLSPFGPLRGGPSRYDGEGLQVNICLPRVPLVDLKMSHCLNPPEVLVYRRLNPTRSESVYNFDMIELRKHNGVEPAV